MKCLPTLKCFLALFELPSLQGPKAKEQRTRRSGIQFPVQLIVDLWGLIPGPLVPLRSGRNGHPESYMQAIVSIKNGVCGRYSTPPREKYIS